MKKPESEQKREELDVDAETVKDLELDEETADQVQGGGSPSHHNCIDLTVIPPG
jgi:hypothetical protein